jgi:hypothetical protein
LLAGLHVRCCGLPGSLVLAGRILALGLILAGLTLAGLTLDLLSSPGLSLLLTLSATALREAAAARRSATALPAAGEPALRCGAATRESAAFATPSASTPASLRIPLANEPQNENAREEPCPDTTP